jgi:hypothetical protein
VLAQAAVTHFGALVGGKEGDPNVLPLEDIRHQRGDIHVSGVKRKIQWFFTSF